MPGVTAVQQQRIRPIRTDGIDHCRHAVQTAYAPVSFGEGGKIVIGKRVSGRTAIRDAIGLAEVGTGDMRHLTLVRAHPEVDRGFTEIDRFQLRMNVGDMDDADIAEGIKLQQLILSQALLRRKTPPIAKTRCPDQGRGGHRNLQKITARDHGTLISCVNIRHIRMCEY